MVRPVSHKFGLMLIGIVSTLVLMLACGGQEATATPLATAKPATPVSPTAIVATPTAMATAVPTATVAAAGQKPQYGGTLRLPALVSDFDSFDPAYNTSSLAFPVLDLVYDQLFVLDSNDQLRPNLAKSWDISADGKTITVHLQGGVKFQDGTPFNAQAVKSHLERMMDPNQLSPRRGDLQPYIEKIEAVDEVTLKIQQFASFRPLLPLFASDRISWLVSPTAVQKYGGGRTGNFAKNPVGAGPFVLVEWVPGDHVLLKRNDTYWQPGKPYLDSILVQGIGDPTVRLTMLRTGNSDIVVRGDTSATDLPVLRRNPDIKFVRSEGTSIYMLSFNPSKSPYDKKALRQAIAYAIDREKFTKAVLGELATPAYTMISRGWAYNPSLKPIDYDVAKAKQKLTEAGYAKGATIPMGCQTVGVNYRVCEVVQALVQEAGIDIDIQLINPAGYWNMDDNGFIKRTGFGTTNWFFRPDPHVLLQTLGSSKSYKYLTLPDRTVIYSNPEFDRLLDEAATVYDTARAKTLYDRVQTVLAEDAPLIFLSRADDMYSMNRRVQGFEPLGTVGTVVRFVWFEK